MDDSCIFCKLIKGVFPSYKVYENEHVFSFLDINPLARGHCLVIPKKHYKRIDDMPAEVAASLFSVVPKIAASVLKATKTADFNLISNNGHHAGQTVDHVHLHIVPRRESDSGLKISWHTTAINKEDAAELTKTISASL
eukprot:TRINITY_DN10309_c0_g1_i1.p1 TRINITY_DN10309_c0_g1~~TRINITY_DN10309_c0_g1_i1.p1  ORF type:complete len:146 (-),score=0.34 TRINITY_DN10309_c0_g1_i1:46-462(-)